MKNKKENNVFLKTLCGLILMMATVCSFMLIGWGTVLVVVSGGFVFKASGLNLDL